LYPLFFLLKQEPVNEYSTGYQHNKPPDFEQEYQEVFKHDPAFNQRINKAG
jgi:hypothetical protein